MVMRPVTESRSKMDFDMGKGGKREEFNAPKERSPRREESSLRRDNIARTAGNRNRLQSNDDDAFAPSSNADKKYNVGSMARNADSSDNDGARKSIDDVMFAISRSDNGSPRTSKNTFSSKTFIAEDSDSDDDMFGAGNDDDMFGASNASTAQKLSEKTSSSSKDERAGSLKDQTAGSIRVSELDWDDKDGYYKATKDEVLGESRFTVVDTQPLGKGSFATVVKCIENVTLKNHSSFAVKIFRKHLRASAEREVKTLQRLHETEAPLSPRSTNKSSMSGPQSTPRLTPANSVGSVGLLCPASVSSDESSSFQRAVSASPSMVDANRLSMKSNVFSHSSSEQQLSAMSQSNNCNNIVRLFDSFDYRGHRCLVLEEASMTLRRAIDTMSKDGRGVSTNQVFEWGKDILRGLAHMHSNDLAHTNINTENIFVYPKRSPSIETPKASDMIQDNNKTCDGNKVWDALITNNSNDEGSSSKSDPPSPVTAQNAVSMEEWVCKIGGLATARELKKDGTIAWGSHAIDAEHVVNKSRPRNYNAPEVILQSTKTCDARVDIWSAGCIFFELQQGKPLIVPPTPSSSRANAAGNAGGTVKEDAEILESIMKRKGRLPKTIVKGGEKSERFYDMKGNFLNKEYRIPEIVKEEDNLKAEISKAVYPNGLVPAEFKVLRQALTDFIIQTTSLDPKCRPYAEKAIHTLEMANSAPHTRPVAHYSKSGFYQGSSMKTIYYNKSNGLVVYETETSVVAPGSNATNITNEPFHRSGGSVANVIDNCRGIEVFHANGLLSVRH